MTNPATPQPKLLIPLIPPPPLGLGVPEVEVVGQPPATHEIMAPVASGLVGPDGQQIPTMEKQTYLLTPITMPLPCGKALVYVYVLKGMPNEVVGRFVQGYIVGRLVQVCFEGSVA